MNWYFSLFAYSDVAIQVENQGSAWLILHWDKVQQSYRKTQTRDEDFHVWHCVTRLKISPCGLLMSQTCRLWMVQQGLGIHPKCHFALIFPHDSLQPTVFASLISRYQKCGFINIRLISAPGVKWDRESWRGDRFLLLFIVLLCFFQPALYCLGAALTLHKFPIFLTSTAA